MVTEQKKTQKVGVVGEKKVSNCPAVQGVRGRHERWVEDPKEERPSSLFSPPLSVGVLTLSGVEIPAGEERKRERERGGASIRPSIHGPPRERRRNCSLPRCRGNAVLCGGHGQDCRFVFQINRDWCQLKYLRGKFVFLLLLLY